MTWKGSDSARQMRSHPVWESAPFRFPDSKRIQYVLLQAAGEGHTYLPMQELTQRASPACEIETPEHIEQHYMNLAMDRKIIMRQVEDSTQIYAATCTHGGKYRDPSDAAECRV